MKNAFDAEPYRLEHGFCGGSDSTILTFKPLFGLLQTLSVLCGGQTKVFLEEAAEIERVVVTNDVGNFGYIVA